MGEREVGRGRPGRALLGRRGRDSAGDALGRPAGARRRQPAPTQAGILVATALNAAALAFLGHGGEALDGLAPAVAAAALASLLLPLTSGALAAWSLGRMRHA